MSASKRTTEVVEHRDGGDPSTSHKSPGRNKYDAITLERGLTQDMTFHDWAGLVWNYGAALGAEVSLANFRKDIYLEFYNEAGQLVMAYKIYRCWVSEYQAMPDLDANANAIAIEHIKLENEGWERDTSVTEPYGADFGQRGELMRTLSNAEFLELWEHGCRMHPLDRALAAIGASFGPHETAESSQPTGRWVGATGS